MNDDLISRERLNNTILLGNYDTQSKILSAIDNAPTVDIKDELAGAYNEGYMCGSREAEKERPQGEWIRTGSLGNGNAHYECSNCHHGDEHAESQEVPYCWFCGAKMKKGGDLSGK